MRNSIKKYLSAGLIASSLFLPMLAGRADEASRRTADKVQSSPVLIPGARTQPVTSPLHPATAQPRRPVDQLKSTWTGIQNSILGKRKPMPGPAAIVAADRVFYLRELKNRTATHSSPDALVFVRKGFDPSRPITLQIHNHGLMENVVQEFTRANMQKQLEANPPNTVFIMPEWALEPSAYSSNAGQFHKPGFFKAMLTEIFQRTEPLKTTSLNNVADIYVSTFSGGFRATASEVSRNGLEDKVRGITLLDSLYTGDTFDAWLQSHIKDLHDGSRFFHNFFNDTVRDSRHLAGRLERMLDKDGLSRTCMIKDYDNPLKLMPPSKVARYAIIFKYSEVATPGRNLHQSVNSHYIGVMSKALEIRKNNSQIAEAPKDQQLL
ncbi:MAG: hypothetical protein K2W95_21200 [Candidatus Obscuribacterales bacterium]|nr:hypothetical protein [Candidatus Obscuribacterales bacterium]